VYANTKFTDWLDGLTVAPHTQWSAKNQQRSHIEFPYSCHHLNTGMPGQPLMNAMNIMHELTERKDGGL